MFANFWFWRLVNYVLSVEHRFPSRQTLLIKAACISFYGREENPLCRKHLLISKWIWSKNHLQYCWYPRKCSCFTVFTIPWSGYETPASTVMVETWSISGNIMEWDFFFFDLCFVVFYFLLHHYYFLITISVMNFYAILNRFDVLHLLLKFVRILMWLPVNFSNYIYFT